MSRVIPVGLIVVEMTADDLAARVDALTSDQRLYVLGWIAEAANQSDEVRAVLLRALREASAARHRLSEPAAS